MKIPSLRRAVSSLSIAACGALSGCGQHPWYTPRPALEPVAEHWQVQAIRSTEDSPTEFSLQFGVSYKGNHPDYSFWLHNLGWLAIDTSELGTMFGPDEKHLVTYGDGHGHWSYYMLQIPDSNNLVLPGTRIGYGAEYPEGVVENVTYLGKGHTQDIIITARAPIQWVQTEVNVSSQTIYFQWDSRNVHS